MHPSGVRRATALVSLACLGLLLGVAGSSRAQDAELDSGLEQLRLARGQVPRAEDFETARTLGTALGLRAGAYGTSAVLVNPANLGLGRLYHAEAVLQYVPTARAFSYGTVVADGSTERLRAGVASRGILGRDEREYRGNDNRLALGMALGDVIGVGLSLRYLRLRTRDQTSDGYPVSPEVRAITLDTALRVTPFEGFHIAAYGYNLIRTGSVLAPQQFGGGIAYQYEGVLQVGADLIVDTTTFRDPTLLYGAGVEWYAGQQYPLRLGYRRDEGRKLHGLTASFGFVAERYAVELGWRQEFGEYREAQVLVSARYAMDVGQQ